MRTVLTRLLAVAALAAGVAFIPAPAHAAPTTRMEILTPSGALVPCGGNVDGVGSVIVRGFVVNPGSPIRATTRFGYGADLGAETWYSLYSHQVPTGDVLVREVSQRLSPGTTHTVAFGFDNNLKKCTFTASNVPAASEKVTNPRPLPADPVEEVKVTLTRYSDGALIGACSSASPQFEPFFFAGDMGRIRYTVQVRQDGESGYHSVHTHEETGTPISASGPQWWEERAEGVRVDGGGAWTTVTDLTAAQTDGKNVQIHAAQGFAGSSGHIEVFCAATTEADGGTFAQPAPAPAPSPSASLEPSPSPEPTCGG